MNFVTIFYLFLITLLIVKIIQMKALRKKCWDNFYLKLLIKFCIVN